MTETDTIRVTLEDISHGGDAIGRHNGRVVFASYGVPGEKVGVKIVQEKRDYVKGRVIDVLDASSYRSTPPCPYFGACGGCQWQHIEYQYQLKLKQQILESQLKRIGKIHKPFVQPTVPSPSPWHYRNQARFSIGTGGKLGFIGPDARRFIPIDYCYIMHPEINETLGKLQGRGGRRHQITVRQGTGTGEQLVQPRLDAPDTDLSSGQEYYREKLFGYSFKVSGPSFFQVNTPQAERLVAIVRERLDLTGKELLVDAYAGVGTFAVMLVPYVRKVVAVEESASAVKDAEVNCAPFKNIQLVLGKTEEVLPTLKEHPDAVILDPSRVGCHPAVLKTLGEMAPPKIVYVSCDPATLARDLSILCSSGYRLKETQPVDMFPQTYHIESVSTLEFRSDD